MCISLHNDKEEMKGCRNRRYTSLRSLKIYTGILVDRVGRLTVMLIDNEKLCFRPMWNVCMKSSLYNNDVIKSCICVYRIYGLGACKYHSLHESNMTDTKNT